MTDYISRETLENWVREEMASLDSKEDREFVIQRWRKEIPAADAAPVVHGKWGNRQICSNMCGYEYAMMCSVCNKPTYRISMMEDMPPYCQFCGAKMDGGTQDAVD